jgi:hypothetical protein
MTRARNILIAVSLFIFVNAFAQSPRKYITNNMFWTETILNGSIKGKWKYQLDYQNRRQAFNSEADGNHQNIFANRFQQVLRPWIHYQLNPNVRFSLSPIGWWGTWNVPNESVTKFTPEYRICPQITLTQKLGRIEFSQRYRYEFRFLGVADTTTTAFDFLNNNSYVFKDTNKKGRFRYFVRAIIPLNKKTMEKGTLYVNVFDEIFLAIGKNVGNYNLLDQNRSFAGLGYKFNTIMRLELGYLNQAAFKFNNTTHNNVELNSVMQVYLIIDDFNALFKKREKTLAK